MSDDNLRLGIIGASPFLTFSELWSINPGSMGMEVHWADEIDSVGLDR